MNFDIPSNKNLIYLIIYKVYYHEALLKTAREHLKSSQLQLKTGMFVETSPNI